MHLITQSLGSSQAAVAGRLKVLECTKPRFNNPLTPIHFQKSSTHLRLSESLLSLKSASLPICGFTAHLHPKASTVQDVSPGVDNLAIMNDALVEVKAVEIKGHC